MLVTMASILIMFTMMYGASSRSHQVRLKETCAKNLQHIYVALTTYSFDYDGRFPTVTNAQSSEVPLSQLVPRYTTGTEFFICPGSSEKPLPSAQSFADRRISYAYYMGRRSSNGAGRSLMSDRQVNTLPKALKEQLFSPDGKKPANNHHKFGGNILFCDGDIQVSPAKSAFALPLPPNVVLLNPKP